MIVPQGPLCVMVALKPVDFRKDLECLAALVQENLNGDPFTGVIYAFRSKRVDRLKLIFWNGTGMVLVSKRLEGGKFCWPKVADGVMRLWPAQLSALVEALERSFVHAPRGRARQGAA